MGEQGWGEWAVRLKKKKFKKVQGTGNTERADLECRDWRRKL